MAGQLMTQPLGAVGALGMNTQTSPIDLPTEFATLAYNCYADEAGRPTARKSAQLNSTTNVDLGTGEVLRCYRHNKANGTSVMMLAGPDQLYYSTDGSTVTTITAGPFANGYWQFASLNGKCFVAKASTTLGYINETTYAYSTIATPSNPVAIHAAYGRLWAITAGTLYWSDLLDGTNFTTGASGSLDLQKIHTQFRDTAVAITSFNSQIVVLCRNSIYVLGLAADKNPNNTISPIYLRDFVPNIGCYSRDSVVSTGDDVLFLSDDGVRSLSRSMQNTQGPAPLTDISALNKDFVKENLIAGNTADQLVAAWNPNNAWYMLFAPGTSEVWIFDFGRRIPQSNLPRTFIWTMGTVPLYCGLWWTDEVMWYGAASGVYKMETFDPDDSYTMTIKTGWLSLGGAERMDAFKRFMLNLTGGSGQTVTLKWYVDFDENTERSVQFVLSSSQTVYEYNVSYYGTAEYGSGAVTQEIYRQIGGNGKVIKVAIDIPIEGYELTLNNALLFYKQGRVR